MVAMKLVLALSLVQFAAGEHISKCMEERVNISCPRNEVIWIRDAYSCKQCGGRLCDGLRHETSDANFLWNLCNLRDVCDLKVTWYRLDLDYECVPLQRIPMYNICTNAEIKLYAFYLSSPGYPEDLSNNRHCECYTELKKPTNFTVTLHQGRFQFKELDIKLDDKVRGPLSVTNLPIPKEMFKVVYKNNKENTDHRFWMKIFVNECITLTCRDVNALPADARSTTIPGVEVTAGVEQKVVAAAAGGVVGGAVFVSITGVIVAVVLWKRGLRLVRRGKRQSHLPAIDTADYDDTRVEFTTPIYSSVKAASQNPAHPEITGHHAPHGVAGIELASANDEESAYDYADRSTWQQGALSQTPAPAQQANPTNREDATPYETMEGRPEDKYTYNELRILSQGQPAQGTTEGSSIQVDDDQGLTPSRSSGDVAHSQESPYARLEPVETVQYLDFRQPSD